MTPELYWIPSDAGRLAIMARPRSGEWLSDEIAGWRHAGVDVIVSLLEPAESRELGLDGEARFCTDVGIEFVSFPIADRGVPRAGSEVEKLVQAIADKLASGAAVAVHCRAGIGRSALIAACALTRLGIGATQALALISRARGRPVPDTDEQAAWVAAFERSGSLGTA